MKPGKWSYLTGSPLTRIAGADEVAGSPQSLGKLTLCLKAVNGTVGWTANALPWFCGPLRASPHLSGVEHPGAEMGTWTFFFPGTFYFTFYASLLFSPPSLVLITGDSDSSSIFLLVG